MSQRVNTSNDGQENGNYIYTLCVHVYIQYIYIYVCIYVHISDNFTV